MASPRGPGRHSLQPHPTSQRDHVRGITVDVARSGTRLSLGYELAGDLDSLRIPTVRSPARADELWRHTCFEAFVRPADSEPYLELNFSPSGEWAAYRFTGYRAGMTPWPHGAPVTRRRDGAGTLGLEVQVDLSAWMPPCDVAVWRLGLAAVIENRSGDTAYWALAHPGAKPDFHHAGGFEVELP